MQGHEVKVKVNTIMHLCQVGYNSQELMGKTGAPEKAIKMYRVEWNTYM